MKIENSEPTETAHTKKADTTSSSYPAECRTNFSISVFNLENVAAEQHFNDYRIVHGFNNSET